MTLQLNNVSYTFTNEKKEQNQVIFNLNMEIQQGEFVSLIGKSGTGKSTIFKLITGLLKQDTGQILINGQSVSLGDVGYMPQRDLLLPWRTIIENILLPSEIQKSHKISVEEAKMWLQRVGLLEYADAYPKELSGGMRQRTAFLRALLTGKDVLLLDEPFGALDALTKREMQTWLLSIWQQLNKTVLFITHDLEEAAYLSDRIYLLHRDKSVEGIPVNLPRPRTSGMIHSTEVSILRQQLEKKIVNETV